MAIAIGRHLVRERARRFAASRQADRQMLKAGWRMKADAAAGMIPPKRITHRADRTGRDGGCSSSKGWGRGNESQIYWRLAMTDSNQVGCGQAVVGCYKHRAAAAYADSCVGSNNMEAASNPRQSLRALIARSG